MQRLGGLVILVTALGLGSWVLRTEPVQAEPAGSSSDFPLRGALSCAAAACHNAGGPRGSKDSEYTTWVAHDKHARAHEVLSNDVSQRIVKNLHGERALPATETALCLKCHVHPDMRPPHEEPDPAKASRLRGIAEDGVGCESCHGAARDWRTTHYLRTWKGTSAADKAALGFRDTKDLQVRVVTCVRCHVGDKDMEVNHDLIAAGHPRLNFEFGAYHAIMPKHWREVGKNAAADFQARAWMVGQLTSAQAAADLLAHRAASPEKPWPEFAEYSCFSCHHDLGKESWRRRRTREKDEPLDALAWGTWYFALTPAVAREMTGKPKVMWQQNALAEVMRLGKAVPDRKRVFGEAGELSRLLQGLRNEVANAPLDEIRVHALLRRLASVDPLLFQEAEGDAAVQVYLGAAALHHALSDGNAAYRGETPLKGAVVDLRRYLNDLMPREGEKRLDSPAGFDPAAALERLKALRSALSPPSR